MQQLLKKMTKDPKGKTKEKKKEEVRRWWTVTVENEIKKLLGSCCLQLSFTLSTHSPLPEKGKEEKGEEKPWQEGIRPCKEKNWI